MRACVCVLKGSWGVDLPMYGVMWLDSITVNLVLLFRSCHCVKTNNHRQVQLSRQRNLCNMFCACICQAKSITATSTWSLPLSSSLWMTSKKYFVSAESLFDGKPAPHYSNSKLKRAKSWRCQGFPFCCQKYLHRPILGGGVLLTDLRLCVRVCGATGVLFQVLLFPWSWFSPLW